MITAISKLEPDWYIPETEKEEATPTKFLLSPLNSIDNLRIGRLVKIKDDDVIVDADAIEIALIGGLKGWVNFNDSKGSEVVFAQLQKLNISRIPQQYMLELAAEIVMRSNTTEEEEKK